MLQQLPSIHRLIRILCKPRRHPPKLLASRNLDVGGHSSRVTVNPMERTRSSAETPTGKMVWEVLNLSDSLHFWATGNAAIAEVADGKAPCQ